MSDRNQIYFRSNEQGNEISGHQWLYTVSYSSLVKVMTNATLDSPIVQSMQSKMLKISSTTWSKRVGRYRQWINLHCGKKTLDEATKKRIFWTLSKNPKSRNQYKRRSKTSNTNEEGDDDDDEEEEDQEQAQGNDKGKQPAKANDSADFHVYAERAAGTSGPHTQDKKPLMARMTMVSNTFNIFSSLF